MKKALIQLKLKLMNMPASGYMELESILFLFSP